jgi:glutathione peroxidase
MKTKLFFLLSLFFISGLKSFSQTSIYDFKVTTIDGKTFDFNSLRGKKVMIVNVASKCGNTPQYTDLEKLSKMYNNKNFVIIGFPSNSFFQEPGTNEDIKNFCSTKYDVTFPIMSKISVKGDDMHPIYKWLTRKSQNGVMDSYVKWNFQKYLIDENGTLSKVVDPKVNPMDKEIVNWISDHSEKK